MPNPAFKVRPKPIQAKRAFGTYAKDMNFVSLPANKHPSEAMELVWSNNAKEETGEISFINAATVLSVVKEYGKYTGTILEKTAEKHPMHKAANNKRFVISNAALRRLTVPVRTFARLATRRLQSPRRRSTR